MHLTGGVLAYGAVISGVDPFACSLSLLSYISFAAPFYRPFLGLHIQGELRHCFFKLMPFGLELLDHHGLFVHTCPS